MIEFVCAGSALAVLVWTQKLTHWRESFDLLTCPRATRPEGPAREVSQQLREVGTLLCAQVQGRTGPDEIDSAIASSTDQSQRTRVVGCRSCRTTTAQSSVCLSFCRHSLTTHRVFCNREGSCLSPTEDVACCLSRCRCCIGGVSQKVNARGRV